MQQQSDQINKRVHHLKNIRPKLGNVTVLTATSTTAASWLTGILMNLLPHNSETLGS